MKRAATAAIVLVTAPNLKTARKLAAAALESRLAACANLVPGLESHYWWKGKLERASEILIFFKTTRAQLNSLEKLILSEHPYDTPEFLVLRPHSGTARYLAWIEQQRQPEPKTPRRPRRPQNQTQRNLGSRRLRANRPPH